MATHKALVLHSHDQPLALEEVPSPEAGPGSAVVEVLAADIVPYMADVLTGKLPYPLTLPLTPGSSAIARVIEAGPDAAALQPGQLVLCDITVRARDDPGASILLGIHGGTTPGARQLMAGEWRHGTYAQRARLPLENLHALDEDALCGRQGYSVTDLCVLSICAVPFGGLAEVELRPGETVVVAPATGRFGGAAVAVALAMGARVVAAGRNRAALAKLEEALGATGRLTTVVLADGDVDANTAAIGAAIPGGKGADVFLDMSPPAAAGNQMLTAAVSVLRPFGRCAIMGGIMENVSLPYIQVMLKSLRFQGRFMFDRDHIKRLIGMAESGLLKLGAGIGMNTTKEYSLENIEDALEEASKLTGWGSHVVLRP